MLLSALVPHSAPYIIVGGVLPDIIDYTLKLKHRSKITHNMLIVPLLSVTCETLPVGIGILHHLVLDMFTSFGVYVGWRRFHVTKIKSNDPLANSVVVLVHILFLALIL